MSAALAEATGAGIEADVGIEAKPETETSIEHETTSEGLGETRGPKELVENVVNTVRSGVDSAMGAVKTVGTAAVAIVGAVGGQKLLEELSGKTTIPREVIAGGALLGLGLLGFGIYKLIEHSKK